MIALLQNFSNIFLNLYLKIKSKIFSISVLGYWLLLYVYKSFSKSEWEIKTINNTEYIMRPTKCVTTYWDALYFCINYFILIVLFLYIANISKDKGIKKFAKYSGILTSFSLLYKIQLFFNVNILNTNEAIIWNLGFGLTLIPFLYILYRNE